MDHLTRKLSSQEFHRKEVNPKCFSTEMTITAQKYNKTNDNISQYSCYMRKLQTTNVVNWSIVINYASKYLCTRKLMKKGAFLPNIS